MGAMGPLGVGVHKGLWSCVANHLPGRIGKQCRDRWYNHLDPAIRRGPWSAEENEVIIQAFAQLGDQWSEIAKLLPPRRPDNAIENHWNSELRGDPRRAEECGVCLYKVCRCEYHRKATAAAPPPRAQQHCINAAIERAAMTGSVSVGSAATPGTAAGSDLASAVETFCGDLVNKGQAVLSRSDVTASDVTEEANAVFQAHIQRQDGGGQVPRHHQQTPAEQQAGGGAAASQVVGFRQRCDFNIKILISCSRILISH